MGSKVPNRRAVPPSNSATRPACWAEPRRNRHPASLTRSPGKPVGFRKKRMRRPVEFSRWRLLRMSRADHPRLRWPPALRIFANWQTIGSGSPTICRIWRKVCGIQLASWRRTSLTPRPNCATHSAKWISPTLATACSEPRTGCAGASIRTPTEPRARSPRA